MSLECNSYMGCGHAVVIVVAFLWGAQASELVEQLCSEKLEERETASRALRGLGTSAVAELKRVSKDKDAEVTARAVRLLRIIEIDGLLTPHLILAHPEISEHVLDHGPGQWATEFVRLKDERLELWQSARYGSAWKEWRKNFDKLAPLALEFSTGEKGDVLYWVGKWRLTGALAATISCLDDKDGASRARAVSALGELEWKEGVPRLIPLLRDDVAQVRESTIQAMVALQVQQAIPGIKSLLEDPKEDVRSAAIRGLGTLKAVEAAPLLLKLLEQETPDIKCDLLIALAQLRYLEAVPAVISHLNDPSTLVQTCAIWPAGVLLGAESIPKLVPLLESPAAMVRNRALGAISHYAALSGTRSEILNSRVKAMLQDADDMVRSRAIWALIGIEEKADALTISRMLRDKDPTVRCDAATALAWLEAVEYANAIEALLEDEDPGARLAAARSLCNLGSTSGVGVLLKESGGSLDQAACLNSLNALRQRDAWRKLSRTTMGPPQVKARKDLVRELAAPQGFEVIFEEDLPEVGWGLGGEGAAGGMRVGLGGVPIKAVSIADGIEDALMPADYGIILEGKGLRIVSFSKALAFWREWSRVQKKR